MNMIELSKIFGCIGASTQLQEISELKSMLCLFPELFFQ